MSSFKAFDIAGSGMAAQSVRLNTTAQGATSAVFAVEQTFGVGTGPYLMSVGDLNGDGKSDLVVANYSNSVSVLLNTTARGATGSGRSSRR